VLAMDWGHLLLNLGFFRLVCLSVVISEYSVEKESFLPTPTP